MPYDVIIIGSGISGLYAAYNIKKQDPNLSILILEKHKRQWIGGRASNESFYGVEIATGAGIGRKRDKLLKKLVLELGFDVKEFKSVPHYSTLSDPIDVLHVMEFLRGQHKKYRGPPTTFERFAKPILGAKTYRQFLESSGYTDYEKEDAYDTLYNYGMEDNAGLTGFGVHWRKMVLALAAKIGEPNIKFSQNVVAISGTEGKGEDKQFAVETEGGRKYNCKRIIVATTVTSLRSLFPDYPIYREIEGQPFLRVYGKFAKQSIPIMKEYVRGYTCVTGPIQKMIPMNPDEGVYMIVYNDNANAIALKSRTENTEENREFYCELIEKTLGIPNGRLHLIGIRSYYWGVGTHYYKPLHIFSFKSPTSWAEMNETSAADCAFTSCAMRNGVKTEGISGSEESGNNKLLYKDRDEFINKSQHPQNGILVVGEVVSKHQGWVEGALESVNAVVTKKWIENI